MKRAGGWLAALAASGLPTASVQAAEPTHAALAAAATQARPKLLYSPRYPCDTSTTIEVLLKQLVDSYARKNRRHSEPARCQIPALLRAGDERPSHPKARNNEALIEICMEKPTGGHPGEAYTLRSGMMTKDDGPDLERRRTDLQAEWDERFPAPADAQRCTNE